MALRSCNFNITLRSNSASMLRAAGIGRRRRRIRGVIVCRDERYFRTFSSVAATTTTTTPTPSLAGLSSSSLVNVPTTRERYAELVATGALSFDEKQYALALRLSRLERTLAESESKSAGLPFSSESVKTDGKIENDEKLKAHEVLHRDEKMALRAAAHHRVPRGFYIHGDVGTGKTMCVDIFNNNVTENRPKLKTKRAHFHEFMMDVHSRVHALKQKDLKNNESNDERSSKNDKNQAENSTRGEGDAIVDVAKEIAAKVRVLCLDEFQVTDVADAMIMRRLFTTLFLSGTVVVATSNRPPEELYEGGLNRFYFLPFVDTLKKFCKVHAMQSTVDHRRTDLSGDGHHLFAGSTHGDDEARSAAMDAVFHKWAAVDGANVKNIPAATFPVRFGRNVRLPAGASHNGVCRISFDALCVESANNPAMSAPDYEALCAAHDAFVVDKVPVLDPAKSDVARRFVTFVDMAYDQGARVAMSSPDADTPDGLFSAYHCASSGNDLASVKVKETKWISSGVTKTYPRGDDNISMSFRRDAVVAVGGGDSRGDASTLSQPEKELRFALKRAASRIVHLVSANQD